MSHYCPSNLLSKKEVNRVLKIRERLKEGRTDKKKCTNKNILSKSEAIFESSKKEKEHIVNISKLEMALKNEKNMNMSYPWGELC